MERLEDEADGGVAQRRQIVFTQIGDVVAFDEDATIGGAVEARDQAEQRRLAAAAAALDHNKFTGFDGKRDIIQHPDGPLCDRIGFTQIAGF